MAEPSLSLLGNGTTQDPNWFRISKVGLAEKITNLNQSISFIPTDNNNLEQLLTCVILIANSQLTPDNRDTDPQNIQVEVVYEGKSLDTTSSNSTDYLRYDYRVSIYESVLLGAMPNPSTK